MTLVTTGHDPESGRSLTLHAFESPGDFPSGFTAPSQYFIAMLVCNVRQLSYNDIAELSRKLIDAGCAYLCCWGRDCERVHDGFDTERIESDCEPNASDTIMTTWHTDDSLDEFIEYAVCVANPTDKYQDQCNSVVAIVINNADAAEKIREVFTEPAVFHANRDLES